MVFTERQIAGSMVTLAIAALIYICSVIFPLFPRHPGPIPFLVRTSSSIAVELKGNGTVKRGIYFVPEGTTVGDFLKRMEGGLPAGISPELSGRRLLTGSSLEVLRNAGGRLQLAVGEMRAGQKLALGLPVNINRASAEELLLIPGVGEKTAAQIISLRQALGSIHRLDELMSIRGIKEKRLAKLQKYFCVDDERRK